MTLSVDDLRDVDRYSPTGVQGESIFGVVYKLVSKQTVQTLDGRKKVPSSPTRKKLSSLHTLRDATMYMYHVFWSIQLLIKTDQFTKFTIYQTATNRIPEESGTYVIFVVGDHPSDQCPLTSDRELLQTAPVQPSLEGGRVLVGVHNVDVQPGRVRLLWVVGLEGLAQQERDERLMS